MRTCISMSSLFGEFSARLEAIASAGFDAIELPEGDILLQGGDPADVGRIIKEYGLDIALLTTITEPEGLPPPLRGKAFDRIERLFDTMAALGTDLMLLGSSTHPATLGGIDRLAADLAELGRRAAARGMRIGYEARLGGRHISDYRDAWEVVRRTGQANVGLVLDSFHVLDQGLSPEAIRAVPDDRLFHVQLADAPLLEMDRTYKSQHFRVLPGEGSLPLAGFLCAIASTGYRGAFGLEVSARRGRGSVRSAAIDAGRALRKLVDEAQRREPAAWAERPVIPPRARVHGVEFVEFAASAEDAEKLTDMLACLGFAPVARHVSKEVTLWRQGEINLVINCEPRGYAHSAYVMHGTSVCDIGLLVDDAEATSSRALAFGANNFASVRQPGELAIPAVRGVGGSVLHFLDHKEMLARVWETEFRPLRDVRPTKPVGLTRIDHVAQVMRMEEMPSWILFYAATLDVEQAPEFDVADPGGIVHSRALQSADGRLRFTLNGVDTHRTFAGRFISDTYGASVQHLAFATDDLLATAAKLRDNGFQPLPIPDAYYTEVAAEFCLDADYMVHLKASSIMYDVDVAGHAYLQLYSRPFGEGFFFEVVERQPGYGGYGAPNAAYRTAALHAIQR